MTISSMTGFGQSALQLNGQDLTLSLKSVNHRGLDLKVSLPSSLEPLAGSIEKELRAALGRGRVSLRIELSRGTTGHSSFALDEALAQKLLTAAKRLETLGAAETFGSAELLAWPGLLGTAEPPSPIDAEAPLREALDAALEELTAMRVAEGTSLAAALREGLARCTSHRAAIAARWPALIEGYQRRLGVKLQELLELSDWREEPRVLMEVALLSERADIEEELTRLGAHFEHFEALLKEGRLIGRRLDFLCQELLRESNTIASKAQDQEITPLVIELKGEIERLREQAANIE